MSDQPASTTLFNGVNDIKKLANALKGILALGDFLEPWASVEQAAQEAQGRLNDLHLVEAELEAKVIAVTTQLEDSQKRAKEIRDLASVQAQAIREQARVDAQQLKDDTQAGLEAILLQAQGERDAVYVDLGTAQAQLDALQATIAEREQHLNDLNTHIAEMKESIAGIGK